jgi:hypothetical protein
MSRHAKPHSPRLQFTGEYIADGPRKVNAPDPEGRGVETKKSFRAFRNRNGYPIKSSFEAELRFKNGYPIKSPLKAKMLLKASSFFSVVSTALAELKSLRQEEGFDLYNSPPFETLQGLSVILDRIDRDLIPENGRPKRRYSTMFKKLRQLVTALEEQARLRQFEGFELTKVALEKEIIFLMSVMEGLSTQTTARP